VSAVAILRAEPLGQRSAVDAIRIARIVSARMERGRAIAWLLSLDADDAFGWDQRPMWFADRLLSGVHDNHEPVIIEAGRAMPAHELVRRSIANLRAGKVIAAEMRKLASDIEVLVRPDKEIA
jgi:hypothetical protein